MPAVSERDRLLLMLAGVPGLGERTLGRLLDSGFPLARLFDLPTTELQGRFGLTRRAAEVVSGGAERLYLRTAPQARLLEQYGIRLILRGEPAYPPALAGEGNAAPPVLYAYGNLTLLRRQTVAFLSSGEESRAALEQTAALAGEYARAGMVLVSGHNRPGYRAAVAAAKASGGDRVLVLDCGLERAFGGEMDRDLGATARVWGYSFEPETTLTLSSYPLAARFAGLQNRRRDRQVALLADRIIAVAIRSGGVMEGECRAARARGQTVLVYAGADAPEGNRLLLADGFPPLDG